MFFRCSGVVGGELGAEDGARVGDESTDPGGATEGSNSRSGRGDETNGLRVTRKIRRRKMALASE